LLADDHNLSNGLIVDESDEWNLNRRIRTLTQLVAGRTIFLRVTFLCGRVRLSGIVNFYGTMRALKITKTMVNLKVKLA